MANQRRIERINSLMKRIISEEITFRLRDPRIGFVTITRVSITPDLSDAKVYFSVLGDEEQIRTTTRGLKSSTGPIRSVVAREMDLRSVPTIEFVFDPSLREQAEIDRILREDRKKREAAEGGVKAGSDEKSEDAEDEEDEDEEEEEEEEEEKEEEAEAEDEE